VAYFHDFFALCLEEKLIKLKILFTIPNFDTAGSGKALLNVAKNLDKHIFEPQIACFHNRGKYFKVVEKEGIPVHIHQTSHEMIPRFKGLINCIKLAKYFKMLKVDLIHSFHYGADYSEALASKIAGIPWVYTKKNMNWGGLSKNGWYIRSLLSKHILVQNNDMIKEFFPNSNKLTLVQRGVNLLEFKKSKKNEYLLEKYKLKSEFKIILCVANLHPAKGVEVLIESFLIISRTKPNIKLFIVGENNNEYAESLMQISRKSKHAHNIIFTGKVFDVKKFYSIADLFILPTLSKGRREGCPVSLLEAIASGVSVLGSEVSGIKDILKDYDDALFEPDNVIELSKKIEEKLFTNKNKNKKLDLKIFKHIKDNFDVKIESFKHGEIYKKILKKKEN